MCYKPDAEMEKFVVGKGFICEATKWGVGRTTQIHLPDSKGLRVIVEIKKQGSPRYTEHGER